MSLVVKRNREGKWRSVLQVSGGLGLLFMAICRTAGAEVTVYAAISLRESLQEIAGSYEKGSGDRVVISLGASSMLARQIEAGATPDVFVSADKARMDSLQAKGLILNSTRRDLLKNSLAIVVACQNGAPISGPEDLAKPQVKRVAMADARGVPAGVYGKEYLVKKGLWRKVEEKTVAMVDVRAALAAVAAGNADAAIVYKTDAATSRQVRAVFDVPEADGPKIVYPAALVVGSKSPAAGARFFKYLFSTEAQALFRKHGFVPITNTNGPLGDRSLPN